MCVRWMGMLGLIVVLGLSSCQDKAEPTPDVTDTQPEKKPPPVQFPQPAAPLIGQPTGSGFADEPIRVQIGPDENLREQHSPSPDHQFLFVRFMVDESATLVSEDYPIVADGEVYYPHAIGFGHPNGVYASVESFLDKRIDLVRGSDDQIFHDGARVQKSELEHLLVFLVYDVPRGAAPTLWHGEESFALSPNYSDLVADLSGSRGNLTSQASLDLPDPNETGSEFSARLIERTRSRVELVGTPVQAVILTLELSVSEDSEIELKKNDIRLRGSRGGNNKGPVYLHFKTHEARPTAGSNIIEEETYEGAELIGLESGSIRLPLSLGEAARVTMIFPQPPSGGDLTLQLSSAVAVNIPEPANPLGQFPPPLEKLPDMVAWAPMIGTPTEATFSSDSLNVAPRAKDLSDAKSTNPGDGLRFLVVRFQVTEESLLVPVDYRIADAEANTIYRPYAVAFGEMETFVKGLDYEKIPLTFGETTAPELQGNRVQGWTLKEQKIALLYEVAPADELIFLHGGTQFVIAE